MNAPIRRKELFAGFVGTRIFPAKNVLREGLAMGNIFSGEDSPQSPGNEDATEDNQGEKEDISFPVLSIEQRVEDRRSLFEHASVDCPLPSLPKDVWDLILGWMTSLDDVTSFSHVCRLFNNVARASRVWPRVLDTRFGAGTSTTIAQSRVTLDHIYNGGRKVANEELEQAQARFHRRAKQEYQKLHYRSLFQNGNGPNELLGGKLYWGCDVIALDNDEPQFVFLVSLGHGGQCDEYDTELKAKPFFWRGTPVLPWEACEGRLNVIVRMYCNHRDVLMATSRK